MRSPLFPALALILALGAPARATPESDAAVLSKQAQRLESDGNAGLAGNLYRAALGLTPADAELHRLYAQNLYKQGKCGDAVPAFRSFMELAPPAARTGAAWDDAIVNLAMCLRAATTHLEVTPDSSAHATGLDVVAAVTAPPPPPLVLPPPPPIEEPVPVPSLEPIAPLPPPVVNGRIVLTFEGRGWLCRLDGAAAVSPTVENELVYDTAAGEHHVACDRLGALPYAAIAVPKPGEQVSLRVELVARRDAPVDDAPDPAVPHVGSWEVPTWQWVVEGGISPAVGTVGMGVGARATNWELVAGSGLYPFALTVSHLSNPGGSGLYWSAGYVRVAEGLLFGGSSVHGHGAFASAGAELRSDRTLAWRVGLGLGLNSSNTADGALTLDLAVVYLP